MFSTLKCSNFSVNIVCVAGVFFPFLFRPRYTFREAVTLTLGTTKKTHIKNHQLRRLVWIERNTERSRVNEVFGQICQPFKNSSDAVWAQPH